MVLAYESLTTNLTQFRRKPMHDRATHLKLLTMYLDAVPHFVPTTNDDICAPTLWHPDLSLNNVFVSKSGPGHLQSLIDWQHAVVLPYFMLGSAPRALMYNPDKVNMDWHLLRLQLATRHHWYERSAWINSERRGPICELPHVNELVVLPSYVTRA